MALIQCPECSREVSSEAATCPHCGYPLHRREAAPKPSGDAGDQRVRETLVAGGKIAAIKLCRELHPGMDLAAAKRHVDQMVETLPAPVQQRLGGIGCLVWLVAGGAVAVGCGRLFF